MKQIRSTMLLKTFLLALFLQRRSLIRFLYCLFVLNKKREEFSSRRTRDLEILEYKTRIAIQTSSVSHAVINIINFFYLNFIPCYHLRSHEISPRDKIHITFFRKQYCSWFNINCWKFNKREISFKLNSILIKISAGWRVIRVLTLTLFSFSFFLVFEKVFFLRWLRLLLLHSNKKVFFMTYLRVLLKQSHRLSRPWISLKRANNPPRNLSPVAFSQISMTHDAWP